ncbi:hypothetical protein E2C01_080216 [Portunus trituberculatus]|uniref:Uncharacterized protein n=1 Tax=Portunus trituberculatus TaxID=210409 RepID=A0A5B7ITG2_PORTR|nr:hypothetical protein [Portunus trituberculatus]
MQVIYSRFEIPAVSRKPTGFLNTPAPFMDKTRTTLSPTLPRSYFKTKTGSSTSSSSHAQHANKTPCNQPCKLPSIAKMTRKSITLKVKLDIIHRHERPEN